MKRILRSPVGLVQLRAADFKVRKDTESPTCVGTFKLNRIHDIQVEECTVQYSTLQRVGR